MPEPDLQVLEILDDLIRRLRAGEPVGVEDALGAHPELAAEIRSLWATMMIAENLGRRDVEASGAADSEPSQTHENFLPGTSIGEYDLLEEIGRGGMGVVYLARQRRLNRTVAVKMLQRGDLALPRRLERFLGEAQAAGRLDHPHIIPVYDVGQESGLPYFSMPYIQGTSLARRIAEQPLPGREAAELLIPVCRAVAYAHQRGILHRDLKPSNILIDPSGRPLVSDFGLAKRFDSEEDISPRRDALTETGAILGTPGYMAPEQALGRRDEIGPVSDVYSLGAVLYACVTGRPPVQAATPADALLLILEQDPPPPRVLNPQIDGDLEMIILKALQKPADLRYQTAAALADDLEAFLRHEPVAARSSHFTQVLSRVFRPTHHVGVLENWGLLWMLHAVVVFLLCVVTDLLKLRGVTSRPPYVLLWTVGLGAWGGIFWNLRRRSGPVTFVERQIAHVWGASMACSCALFGVEYLLGLPVLTLSPVLALIAGSVFVAKAGILSGEFYFPAAALYLAAIPMALLPRISLTLFGLVSGAAFFIPGLKYHLLSRSRGHKA